MKSNIKAIFRCKTTIIIILLVSLGSMGIFVWLSDYKMILGNYGEVRYILEVAFQIIMSLLIGVFAGLNAYRFTYFKTNNKDQKRSLIATLGAFLGALVIGCPACGFTLAGALGMVGFLSLLPFGGQELKYIGIAFLIFANLSLLKDLRTCPVRKNKNA